MAVIFIGLNGSGKDTQAQILEDQYGFISLSGGQLVREEIESKSKLGQKINAIYDKGDLVDDAIIFQLFRQRLKRLTALERRKVAITGTPRREEQIEPLKNMLAEFDAIVEAVFSLEVPEEIVIERLSGRLYAPKSGRFYHPKYNPPQKPGVDDETGEALITRDDDQPEAVRRKIAVIKEDLNQIQAAYKSQGLLHKVDANQSVEAVSKEIHQILSGLSVI